MAKEKNPPKDELEGEKIFVGCDDGHDSIKIVVRTLGQKDVTRLTVPSKIVRGGRAVSLTNDSGGGGVYTAGGQQYTVSDALSGGDVIDTRTIGYPQHEVNRVLVHDVLVRAGLGGKDVHLVTGLPVSDYYKNDSPNTVLTEAKRANICSSDIQPKSANTKLANIVDHRVACEAIAAVYDMVFRDDGTDNEDFFRLLEKAPVGVIDIGGKTTDMAVVYLDHGAPQVDLTRTSSLQFGMLRVQSLINQELMSTHNLDDISPRALYRVITEKRLQLFGEDLDVEKEVATAVAKVVPDLFDRLQATWKSAADLGRVIVVGGGAYLLGEAIKNGLYKHAEVRKEPEYANARGMLKLGIRNYLQANIRK